MAGVETGSCRGKQRKEQTEHLKVRTQHSHHTDRNPNSRAWLGPGNMSSVCVLSTKYFSPDLNWDPGVLYSESPNPSINKKL